MYGKCCQLHFYGLEKWGFSIWDLGDRMGLGFSYLKVYCLIPYLCDQLLVNTQAGTFKWWCLTCENSAFKSDAIINLGRVSNCKAMHASPLILINEMLIKKAVHIPLTFKMSCSAKTNRILYDILKYGSQIPSSNNHIFKGTKWMIVMFSSRSRNNKPLIPVSRTVPQLSFHLMDSQC